MNPSEPENSGPFVNLDGTWVRHNLIAYATQRQAPAENGEGTRPYCAVVLTVPGAKTLHYPGPLSDLFRAVAVAQHAEEVAIGLFRARGMREGGVTGR